MFSLALLVAAALAGTARAQPASDDAIYGAPGSTFHVTSQLLGRALRETADPSRPKTPPVATTTSGRGHGARMLAATWPPPVSENAERLFAALLVDFAKVEPMLGAPAGDVAGAAAMFVIAAYETARDKRVDPSAYKPVADQLRRALATSPSFAKATPAQRRDAYEQLAMLGMFLGVRRTELAYAGDKGAQEGLRESARAYLADLSLDPDTMQVDRSGITKTPAAPAASPRR